MADTPESGPLIIPTDAEVQSYCEAWPGDLSRGIPAGIPEAWWLQWLAKPRHTWPRNWQQALMRDFTSDWIARRPKAVHGSGPARSLVPENTARQAGDIDWWWTGSLSDLDAAIAGARLGGDVAMWERLKNIRAARRGR